MHAYLQLLSHIKDQGVLRANRTGVSAYSIFGYQLRFDLSAGFPLLTTKKVHFKSVVYELLWFLRGDTNIDWLQRHGVTIWDEWADADGNLGPVYGAQWRSWRGPDGKTLDQIARVVASLQCNPDSRRHIVSAWNVGELDQMQLVPCHVLFQFHVQQGRLSCALYQRSADVFLGAPFNIASYALLTQMIAQVCNLQAGELIHFLGDAHLYENHLQQATEQLTHTPRTLPTLRLNPQVRDLFAFRYEDISLQNYHPYPAIRAPVAV